MDYLYAIIFGIVQGLTEFLPVSSSGHLIILHEIIKLPVNNELAFDVALHFATLLAILSFFKNDIFRLVKSWLKSFMGAKDEYSRLSWLIILGTIPAGLAGWMFEDTIESVFRSPWVVIAMLIFVGALFIVFEKIGKFTKEIKDINWKNSLAIGIAQAIALIPGTSRSGATIIAGIGAGLKREAALRFSFLLSVPVILGATVKKMPQVFNGNLITNDYSVLIVAFLFSFVSGFLAIKYFLLFSKKHSLNIFAVYRFALAAILILYFFLTK